MHEMMLLGRTSPPDPGTLSFDDFSRVTGDTVPAKSVTLAPNGDSCVLYDDSGAGCLSIDLSTLFLGKDFSVGLYIRPTSFNPVYGSTPSRGIVMQLGPFANTPFYFHSAPGNAGFESDGNATYPMPATPANQWSHVALSFQQSTKKLTAFMNGAPVSRTVTKIPTSFLCYFGGIGDRPGVSGGSVTRYGYRGLMATPRAVSRLITTAFDPLQFPNV